MENHRVVLELPEAAIAVEAEQSSNSPGRMIVIDVLGRSGLADGAQSTLLSKHVISFCGGDAVATG
jgi:ABC-type transporter lipoprotein component MlaA